MPTETDILDALPAHVALLDTDGIIVQVNRAWQQFAAENGLSGQRLGVGVNYLAVCDSAGGRGAPEAADGIRRILSGRAREFSLEYPCHAPGEPRWFQLMVSPLDADRDGGAVVMHIDITARRLAEVALEASAGTLSAAQRIAHVGSWELDLANRLDLNANPLRWSDEMYRIAGFEPGQVEVTNDLFFQLAHPDDHAAIKRAVDDALRDRKPYSIVHRLIRPDGEERIVHERAELYFDEESGSLLRMVGTAHDITEQRRLEQQLFRAQRMDSIGTLAGGIAHDLNNVLAPILMSIELLKMDETDPEKRSLLTTIETSAERGAAMVRQVLSFARGVEGRRLNVRVPELFRELGRIVADTLPKGIRTTFEAPDDLPPLVGDPTQLQQVLVNLCVNARDAMPTGGRLTVSAWQEDIDEQYAGAAPDASPGPHIVLAVEDTGSGMHPETLDKAFEPFFTTKDHGKGTGLGLSTALAIVKSHGGFMRASSQPGRGTRVLAYLPAQENNARAADADLLVEPPRGHGELILVVDDESNVRTVTRQTLEAFGYRTIEACDGAEAVAIYAARHADVAAIITDMMMPVLDGPGAIPVFLKINPAVPILGVTGLGPDGKLSLASVPGLRQFLPKPFTAQALLTALNAVLHPSPATVRSTES